MTLMMAAVQLAASTAARAVAVSVLTTLAQSAVAALVTRGLGVVAAAAQIPSASTAAACRQCERLQRGVDTRNARGPTGQQGGRISGARPRTARRRRIPAPRPR